MRLISNKDRILKEAIYGLHFVVLSVLKVVASLAVVPVDSVSEVVKSNQYQQNSFKQNNTKLISLN